MFSSDLIARIIANGQGATLFAARPGYLAFPAHCEAFSVKRRQSCVTKT